MDVIPKSRVVEFFMIVLFVPYALIACSALTLLYGIAIIVALSDKKSGNISTTTKSGSRTARYVLQLRAHCTSFGYGPDTMAPALFAAVNSFAGSRSERILSKITYWLIVFTFKVFRKDLHAFYTNVVNGLKGNVDLDVYNHLRTCWVDDVIETFIQAEMKRGDNCPVQVVILGAGYDSRAYGRLPCTKQANVSFFEVDSPATQRVKRKALGLLNVDTSHVRYVSVDFERENWLEKLCQSSDFDLNQRVVVDWEGISMYLKSDSVYAVLKTFRRCASGSILGFDFLRKEFVSLESITRLTKRIGEPWLFGMGHEMLESLTREYGFQKVDELGFRELIARYGPRKGDGTPLNQHYYEWGRFALLKVP